MAIQYTDSYGPVLDTGSGTQPAARANTEVEFHTASESDSGSNTPSAQIPSSIAARHIPHRAANSPR